MKIIKTNRTIEVKVVKFDDGTEIDTKIVYKFLEEALEFEGGIGKGAKYTDSFLYFETEEEKKLELILLKRDVITLSPRYTIHNDNVKLHKRNNTIDNLLSLYNKPYPNLNYYYWLSNGYYEFRDEFKLKFYE